MSDGRVDKRSVALLWYVRADSAEEAADGAEEGAFIAGAFSDEKAALAAHAAVVAAHPLGDREYPAVFSYTVDECGWLEGFVTVGPDG